MDGKGFEKYIRFWHAQVRKRRSAHVCLILDNCSAHGKALPRFPGVEYIFLPPIVTSAYQSFDQSLQGKVKVIARKVLLLRIMANLEKFDEVRELGKIEEMEYEVSIIAILHLYAAQALREAFG